MMLTADLSYLSNKGNQGGVTGLYTDVLSHLRYKFCHSTGQLMSCFLHLGDAFS